VRILNYLILGFFFGLLATGSIARAADPADPACHNFRLFTGPTAHMADAALMERVRNHFQDVPGLQKQLLDMIPWLNSDSKKMLFEVLGYPHLQVKKLTPELRTDWNIDPKTYALAEFNPYADFNPVMIASGLVNNENFLVHSARANPITAEKRMTELAKSRTGNKYVLLISDTQNPDEAKALSDLGTLFHEVAHIRFINFLHRNKERLLKSLPRDYYARDINGVYSMNQQLFTYLTERYAYESERKFLQGFSHTPQAQAIAERFANHFTQPNGNIGVGFDFDLGAGIRKDYKLDDDAFEDLDKLSLDQIFRGKARALQSR
jgi:hypothetical protein